MRHPTLYALDTELAPEGFERLCVDLLYRMGYTSIVPIGGMRDRGRDAERRLLRRGVHSEQGVVFFQFSMEERWKEKLKRELVKVRANDHEIDTFVFVSSRTTTGAASDALRLHAAREFGWQLVVYGREWLRLQLEEVHPDLAEKYLGVRLARMRARVAGEAAEPDGLGEAWSHYQSGDFERAAILLRELCALPSKTVDALSALAICQFELRRYVDALSTVGEAITHGGPSPDALRIKAAALIEHGISRSSRNAIIQGRDLLLDLPEDAVTWQDHFNLGNAYGELGELGDAEVAYKRALELDDGQAPVWKNLGDVARRRGKEAAEIEFYDRALELDPHLVEALVSKAIAQIARLGQPEAGAALLERARRVDGQLERRWPHVLSWLVTAYHETQDLARALHVSEQGLMADPSNDSLLLLRGAVLWDAWRADPSRLQATLEHFSRQWRAFPGHIETGRKLAGLLEASEQTAEAWDLFADTTDSNVCISVFTRLDGCGPSDCMASLAWTGLYARYRQSSPTPGGDFLHSDLFHRSDVDYLEHLDQLLLIPFSRASYLLARRDPDASNVEVASGLARMLEPSIRSAFLVTLDRLAPGLRTAKTDETVEDVSVVVAQVPFGALAEISRQVGYLGATFGVTQQSLLDSAQTEWLGGFAGAVFGELNRIVGLLPNH